MRSRTTKVLSALLLLVSAAACSGEREPARSVRESPVLRQTQEQVERTAGSLRRLDDLPMYAMTYHGDYDAEAPLTDEELARPDSAWACSLFARGPESADGAEFARNFDWDPNAAMVVHSDAPGAYASISVSDVSYVLDGGGPDLKDPQHRRRLGHAVLLPFDGMNEKGLAVGLAQTPDAELPARTPGRALMGTTRIIRLMLDRAATVDEAIALMRRYDVEFTGGPQVHYLIADRTGRAVVAEYGGGRLHVIDDRILTNITMADTEPADRLSDARYSALAKGIGTGADALDLLRRVAQAHTRWSIVYDLDDLTARLVTGKRWSRVHKLTISSPG
ncbi:carcinine hydrolase/isopenicillin-N N-acyltransferase family protein [Nonomuraea sp. CA-218870]|uniref:carcinine hydrolase/isopenicillin-N N-acyltransferase family protein n=1 Tax=Nonomuraea sp. CA-218870 TaxID=3239998 RepID=UPI003D9342FC